MPRADVHVSLKELSRLCAEAGFGPDSVPEAAQTALAGYLELLMKWNRVMNLVGTHTWQATFRTLIVDSLHLARFLRTLPLPEAPETWDLGAGAGLPGIPLRAVWQAGTYHLVDAREKRTLFLSNVLARHPLPGTVVFRGRVEEFMPTRPKADCVVSRAFLPWSEVLQLVRDHVAPGGVVVFLANEGAPASLPTGWKVVARAEYEVQAPPPHGATGVPGRAGDSGHGGRAGRAGRNVNGAAAGKSGAEPASTTRHLWALALE
ncbi:class I SAM-dependent methyltransferase [Nitratidesulfovibrio liaohensis]|uniref:Ribosomal RNA small subunit methyltransferase G n=1 Tax=Nitratidesulfovibrio liaohensis TaxID=2604158 RepID=A0ABY9R4T7_9BACT|nr:RsmG family class I SAM-dependent methyltransferase [Nitratidesulfovibrio liaohensis]WMW66469.1 class I SAM-dependent methyltransferase [Nitratidesulfovibrio liaohensis]